MSGLQDFTTTSRPEQAPPRIAALREAMARAQLHGFIVPRADVHQGEYVSARDERLAWVTGFTGSAGFAIVLAERVGLFVDGRYRVQARVQTDAATITPVNWPETQPGPWLAENAPQGAVIGFDPWLHTPEEIDKLEAALKGTGLSLRRSANLVDRVWPDQPAPAASPVMVQPDDLAGQSAEDKRQTLAAELAAAGHRAAVLTLPDSICWLLNIRGSDVPRTPLVQGFAFLHDDARMTLFLDSARLDSATRTHLGEHVTLRPPEALEAALHTLPGPVRLDRASVPLAVADALAEAGVQIAWGHDPCKLPKARKNPAEISGARAAHLRDGAAMAGFLHWLDVAVENQLHGTGPVLTEIDVVQALEGFRRGTGCLHDISFETIAGSGPNGAIVHYRVSEDSNRSLRAGELLLVDSGGQYRDGTTDITRTIAVGPVGTQERAAFTRVLQGMIALSRARFPRGIAGAHLDALARYPLWLAGQDYDHGTGHGVGAFLSVHEGPQRLSRLSHVALEPGMILSNEPGYYREGAFGIRIENLVVVQPAPAIEGADAREMLSFETLTLAPIDRRLIDATALSEDEKAWLDAYHAKVCEMLSGLVGSDTRDWLIRATAPI